MLTCTPASWQELVVAIYVDDELIAESGKCQINVFVDQVCCNVNITTGSLSSFLGMQIEQR